MTRDRSILFHDVDSLAAALRREPHGDDPLFPPSTETAGVGSGEVSQDDIETLSEQIVDPNPAQFPPSTEKAGFSGGEIEQLTGQVTDEDWDQFPPSSVKAGVPSPEYGEDETVADE